MIGAFASRAASKEATTVEEEVTFCHCQPSYNSKYICTYNSRNGEALLLCILEKLEDVVSHNDTRLTCEYVFGTHSSNSIELSVPDLMVQRDAAVKEN